ncbi:hypothetical protein Bra3105_18445 (plasmid) [Brachybacterium halotolerans subsp. kimchii]|uniref:MinD/ParA family ATP-binding protein n=1 Tax=Brachybacterium halotolerans TaxID=2795215 RepID=UPI001E627994|nr:hypothetical protein [Brachybacterium halotolerans]UEJ84612.1 hypothetical protein Bra3105_18445 [Brachybacterium halotolerans subsp. kimchii]
MTTPSAVPSTWPRITATLAPDGAGEVVINDSPTPVRGTTIDDARVQVTTLITQTAAKLARPVRASVTDPHGQWALLIHPDGRVEEDPNAPRKSNRANRRSSATSTLSAPTPPREPEPEGVITEVPTTAPAMPAPQPHTAEPRLEPESASQEWAAVAPSSTGEWTNEPTSGQEAPSAPAAPAPDPVESDDRWGQIKAQPATQGIRGSLNKIGMHFAPDPSELTTRREELRATIESERAQQQDAERQARENAEQEARRAATAQRNRERRELIQTNFGDCKTITIANQKGGSHKTSAVALLAATFGRIRGGSVIAWDANETMGNLGDRTNSDLHANTVVDLLENAADDFASVETSRIGTIDRYVRQQGDDHFDVLASDEDAERQDMVDDQGFQRIHEILARFKRMIVVDTGNNVRVSHFLAAIDATDQLVIPVAAGVDSATGALKTMEAITARGHGDLVERAVVLVHDSETSHTDAAQLFEGKVAAVVRVPFDPALKDGSAIKYETLSPATIDAYQEAAAAIAAQLREAL